MVSESFQSGKPINPTRPIHSQVYDYCGAERGTKIHMSELRLSNDSSFSLRGLKQSLPWKFQILPDFQIVVNGDVMEPRSIKSAICFDVDYQGTNCGEVTGRIYLTNQRTPNVGMHIYVNNMEIGDAQMHLNRVTDKANLQSRIIGEINAPALSGAIVIDKSGFKETHAGVSELYDFLRGKALEVRRYMESQSSLQKIKKVEKSLIRVADQTRVCLQATGVSHFNNKKVFCLDRLEIENLQQSLIMELLS